MFYLDEKLSVQKEGQVLRGKIEVRRPREDVRSLREEDSDLYTGVPSSPMTTFTPVRALPDIGSM